MARQNKSNRTGAGKDLGVGIVLLHVSLALIAVSAAGLGYFKIRERVAAELAKPGEVARVVLRSPPAWINENLARQIVESAQPAEKRSALDRHLLREVSDAMSSNPWIREVKQVRRVYDQSAGDTIEVDCEFRTPVALVARRSDYILVDADGVRLPQRYSAAEITAVVFTSDGRVNVRVIEGVAAAPPARDGQKWTGDDLSAGIDMVKLLYGKECTEEIVRVNVSNFKGRRNSHEAQLTLFTKNKTEIRWGEPVQMAFYSELTPAEKLERLSLLRQRFGRADGGHSWIDIRLDRITYPAEESTVAQSNGAAH